MSFYPRSWCSNWRGSPQPQTSQPLCLKLTISFRRPSLWTASVLSACLRICLLNLLERLHLRHQSITTDSCKLNIISFLHIRIKFLWFKFSENLNFSNGGKFLPLLYCVFAFWRDALKLQICGTHFIPLGEASNGWELNPKFGGKTFLPKWRFSPRHFSLRRFSPKIISPQKSFLPTFFKNLHRCDVSPQKTFLSATFLPTFQFSCCYL